MNTLNNRLPAKMHVTTWGEANLHDEHSRLVNGRPCEQQTACNRQSGLLSKWNVLAESLEGDTVVAVELVDLLRELKSLRSFNFVHVP
jgi:hypothetical protein